MVAVLFIVFLVALAIGVPVAFSLGLASVAYMLGSHIQMINFAQYFFKGLDSFTLLCIPGFTFAGNLMNQGGISEKLLDFADALVGHITGVWLMQTFWHPWSLPASPARLCPTPLLWAALRSP